MTADVVSLDMHQHVLTLTLNRPDKLNAFDRPRMDALLAAYPRREQYEASLPLQIQIESCALDLNLDDPER